MRRKLLFLMLFVGLSCLPVTVFGLNLNINPSFEIDENNDSIPDGWGIWASSGDYSTSFYVNDPEGAATGDWYVHLTGGPPYGTSCGYQAGDKPNPHVDGTKWFAPIKQEGTYYVGGYAKDRRPGNADSPQLPESEVIYHDDDGIRVDDAPTGPGRPLRHFLFHDLDGTPGTGDYNFVFPRDGEYHLYYGITRPPSELGDATYIAANAFCLLNCEYDFDDMYTGDALPGLLVWGLDPGDEEKGISPNQTTLSWGRQKVCDGAKAIPCEVWWGEIDDPNFWQQNPIKIMAMTDANSFDLADAIGGAIVLQPEENYYWKIVYEEPNECFFDKRRDADTWHFDTINDPPVVDAGLHQDIWQNAGGDPITIGIGASYTDDGNPEGGVVTHSWNTVAGVVYFPHQNCQDPNVTIANPGDYELTLTVEDGGGITPDIQNKTGQDTILIRVIANGDNRLRAHYKLDEAAGTVAADSEETHDGTRIDDAAWQPAGGQVDGAAELDGSDDDADDRGDQIEIDDTGSDPNWQSDTWENSDLIDGMTVSVWMKLDADGWSKGWESIVAKSTDSWEMLRSGTSANAGFAVKGGIGSAGSAPIDVTSGWHQLVGVYDRNTIKLYVDGIETGSNNAGTLNLSAESNFDKDGQPINDRIWQVPKSGGKILIGNTNNPSVGSTIDASFGGLIDQVRIFDAAVPWWAQHAGTPGIVEMYRADGGHISCGGQYVSSDIDEDCFVTLADVALLALDWTECTNVIDVDCDLSHHEE